MCVYNVVDGRAGLQEPGLKSAILSENTRRYKVALPIEEAWPIYRFLGWGYCSLSESSAYQLNSACP